VKINLHQWLAALSVGGATAVGAATGGLLPALVAGLAAALGTFAVRPSQVSRGAGAMARKIPGMRAGQATDDETP
jgi:hypothetical protein